MMRLVATLLVCLCLAQAAHGLSFRNSLSHGAASKFNPTFFQTATPRGTWVLLTRAEASPVANPAVFIGNELGDGILDVQRVVAVGSGAVDLREGDLVYANGDVCEELPIQLNQQYAGAHTTNIAAYCFVDQSEIYALASFGAYAGNRGSLEYTNRFTTIPTTFGVASTGRGLFQESSFNSRILVNPGKSEDFYVNSPTFGTDLLGHNGGQNLRD
jgi:hypothetical protein